MGSIRRSRRGGRGEGASDGFGRGVGAGERCGVGRVDGGSEPDDPAILVKREVKTDAGDYRGFYANVRDAINGDAEQAVKAEDGFRVMKLLEMARVSSTEGRTLKVEF